MALPMSRPVKHPKTGIYQFRKRVPDDLQAVIGRKEVKESLGTRDPLAAKMLHAERQVALVQQWANLRVGDRTLSEAEAHDLARPIEEWFVDQHRDNPSQQRFWSLVTGAALFQARPLNLEQSPAEWVVSHLPDEMRMMAWCEEQARRLLDDQGHRIDDAGRRKMAVAVAKAMRRASVTIRDLFEGRSLAAANQSPAFATATILKDRTRTRPLTFDTIFEIWASERKPGVKTKYSFRSVLNQFGRFLNHTDAAQISSEDVIRWKLSLTEAGLRGKA